MTMKRREFLASVAAGAALSAAGSLSAGQPAMGEDHGDTGTQHFAVG